MRKIFVTAILFLVAAPALADERDEVMAGAARCAGIADKHTWLDCFYGAAQPMRAALGLVPASAAQVRLVPPPGAGYLAAPVMAPALRSAPAMASAAPRPEQPHGFFRDLLGSTRPAIANMPAVKYRFYRNGAFIITLRDGSEWQQDEADAAVNPARWKVAASALIVTITNASMNNYTLRVGDRHGPTYKVHAV